MTTADQPDDPDDSMFEQILKLLQGRDDLPPADTPLGQMTREFLTNTWETCLGGLLQRTERIRVVPEPLPAPRVFNFEMNLPFKSKRGRDEPITLEPGPIRGKVIYRPDLLANLHLPSVAVRLDPGLGYLHPNYSRQHDLICLGDLPPGPFPLDALLENHLYPILSYQNRRPVHPADIEAAQYFALDPEAMSGLEPVLPLY